MVASVQEVSSSLVREYLSRKGLKRTLACMEEEHPRTEASINNRSLLREILNIGDLYKKNKVHNSSFKTLLEIIVNHLIEQVKNDQTCRSATDLPQKVKILSPVDPQAETQPDITDEKVDIPSLGEKDNKMSSEMKERNSPQLSKVSLLSEDIGLSNHDQPNTLDLNLDYQKAQTNLLEIIESSSQKKLEKNAPSTKATQRGRSNHILRGMMAGPVPQESKKPRQNRKIEVSQPLLRKEEENKHTQEKVSSTGTDLKNLESILEDTGLADHRGRKQEAVNSSCNENSKIKPDKIMLKKRKVKPEPSDLKASELVLDDIEDDDVQGLPEVFVQRFTAKHTARPMDAHTSSALKAILHGSNLKCFTVEWKNQGFTFSETNNLSYGIVQKKGGPCGVLAVIQAFFLKKLLFDSMENIDAGPHRLRPSSATRRHCLVLAMAEILWRAGEEKQATVAINSGGHFRSEGVFEKIIYFTVDNLRDLQSILEQHVEQFESGMLGCILMTISAVLSRSIEKVKEDMDVPSNTLIGAHGYCTQELVNLLLCGRAASNVFDETIELDSGNGNITLLRGITGQCNVGLLSLFEHYNICKVGAYLKTPSYPVWVVCSESHFSVLFGLQRELLTNEDKGQEFDLYYYDGLANQQEEIRLTISLSNSSQSFRKVESDLVPPLELCIRTRWKDALVNWNDTEPLL